MTGPDPTHEPAGEELVLDAHLHLLDRQTLDPEGVPAGVVDDLELSEVRHGPDGTLVAPEVTGLLSSPVLVRRLVGGRPPQSRLHRIDWSHVTRVGNAIDLDCASGDLDGTWVERWLRDTIIARIPGGRHDPE